MAYCEERNIPVDFSNKKKKSPYSMDANLLHISYEGGQLEDPWVEAEEDMWRWSVSPEAAPDQPTYIELTYRKGDIVAIDGVEMSPATVLETLNKLGGANGVGRADLVENRYVGMKSRGCYETPGGTIMLKAHRAIESLTLDRESAHLKDELMPRYAKLVYNGYWWSPERKMLQQAIDESQTFVNGKVRVKLYKGNVIIAGRQSDDSLFDAHIATFEDVSVGDTCKEIGVARHGSDNACKLQMHNAEQLRVNRNFELSPRQIVCRRLNCDRVLYARE
jgi:argininosuccinate synthase